jgi:multidrug efflux system membrane fusion protein
MNPGKPNPEQAQEAGLALAPSGTTNSHPEQAQEADLKLAPSKTAESPRKKHRWWLWLLVLCLIGIAAYVLLPRIGQGGQAEGGMPRIRGLVAAAYALLPRTGQNTSQSVKTPEAPVIRAVPVVATAAKQVNLGIYLTALGSVTAFNTVTVRTRVDGQLVKVAFQEGQLLRQGDLLAEIDPRPFQVQLAQAEGQMARDQALLKNAKIDLERYKVLLEQDSIPKQQLDTQIATMNQLEGAIKSDQAQMDSAKLQLTYSRITSPISGRIGLRLVDQGNMVHATDQNGLAVITQLQPIAVLFNIPADDLPQVLKKMRAGPQLVAEAYNRDLSQKLATGTLLTIDNQIDQSTGTIRCKAVFPNEDNTLFPNQFVNVRLLVDTKQNATIVPAAAIQRSPQSTFVYLVKGDSTVEVRNIVVGASEGDNVSIDSGLSPGEVVVTEGVDRLQQGTKVAARTAGVSNSKENK